MQKVTDAAAVDNKTILTVNVDREASKAISQSLQRPLIPFSLDKSLPTEEELGAVFVHSTALQLEDNIIRRLRSRYQDTPIFLICQDLDRDRVIQDWLEGLDDFMMQPLNVEELKLRYDIHNRRHLPQTSKKSVRVDDLYINQLNRSVESGAGKKKISRTEFSILITLAQNYGSMVAKKDIKKQCWGTQAVSDNALNRKIHDVRKVLVDIGSTVELKSIYGKGFILQSGRAAMTSA